MLLHIQLEDRGMEEGKFKKFVKNFLKETKSRLVILLRAGPAMVVLHTSVLRLKPTDCKTYSQQISYPSPANPSFFNYRVCIYEEKIIFLQIVFVC